jgi:hypothetical protein
LEWLVPIIVLLIWFVTNVLRGAEEERTSRRTPPFPGGERPGGGRPSRRPASDIDRFLDEVNRRRRQAMERRPPPRQERLPPPLEVPTALAGTRSPARPGGARPGMPAPAPRPVLERRPERGESAESLIVEVVPASPTPRPEAGPIQPAAALPSTRSTLANPPPAVPPAQAQLTALLQSPDSLCAAFMLREILDRPLCRRYGLR